MLLLVWREQDGCPAGHLHVADPVYVVSDRITVGGLELLPHSQRHDMRHKHTVLLVEQNRPGGNRPDFRRRLDLRPANPIILRSQIAQDDLAVEILILGEKVERVELVGKKGHSPWTVKSQTVNTVLDVLSSIP